MRLLQQGGHTVLHVERVNQSMRENVGGLLYSLVRLWQRATIQFQYLCEAMTIRILPKFRIIPQPFSNLKIAWLKLLKRGSNSSVSQNSKCSTKASEIVKLIIQRAPKSNITAFIVTENHASYRWLTNISYINFNAFVEKWEIVLHKVDKYV